MDRAGGNPDRKCKNKHYSMQRRGLIKVMGLSSLGIAGFSGVSNAQFASNASSTEITDWYDLDAVRDNSSGDYALTNDLGQETAGYEEHVADPASGWDPIGDETSPFTGTFDGNGYTIADIQINRPDEANVGLFGYTEQGTIENVTLETPVVTGGGPNLGTLIGANDGATVRDVICDNGEATIVDEGGKRIGGLIGKNESGQIIRSGVKATVTNNGKGNCGGVVGENEGEINRVYADTELSANRDNNGGIAGRNVGGGEIQNCYTKTEISGRYNQGGIAGFNDGVVTRCYATGTLSGTNEFGGLVAVHSDPGDITESYWEEALADGPVGRAADDGGGVIENVEGLTTGEMQGGSAAENMSLLDFENTWSVETDPADYPALQWETEDTDTSPAITGRVENQNGEPIEGAKVLYTDREAEPFQVGTLTDVGGTLSPGESVSATIDMQAQEDATDNVTWGILGTTDGDVYAVEEMDELGTGTITLDATLPDDSADKDLIWVWLAVLSESVARNVFQTKIGEGSLNRQGSDSELIIGTIGSDTQATLPSTTEIGRFGIETGKTTTDTNGEYSVEVSGSTTYSVIASTTEDATSPVHKSVSVGVDETTEVDFVLQDGDDQGDLLFSDEFTDGTYTDTWEEFDVDDETAQELPEEDVLYHESPKVRNDWGVLRTQESFQATGVRTIRVRLRSLIESDYWEYGFGIITDSKRQHPAIWERRYFEFDDEELEVHVGGPPGEEIDIAPASTSTELRSYELTVDFDSGELIRVKRDGEEFTPDVSLDFDSTETFQIAIGAGRGHEVEYDTVSMVGESSRPTADAGPDQTVTSGDTVTLDASGSSDPDGDTLTYSWVQTDGPEVSVTDADTATAEFTALDVDSQTDLSFEVTVDDGSATDTDATAVTVQPADDEDLELLIQHALDGDFTDSEGDADGTPAETGYNFVEDRSNTVLDLDGSGTGDTGGYYRYTPADLSEPVPEQAKFTFAQWVKPQNNQEWEMIHSGPGATLDTRNGDLRLRYFTNGSNQYVVEVDAQQYLPNDEWTHVVGVIEPEQRATLYVNGTEVGSTEIGNYGLTPDDTATVGYLGGDADGIYDAHFVGRIDDVRLYQGALDSQAVQQLYEDTSGGGDSPEFEEVFFDDFEDGEYETDPAWQVSLAQGDFTAQVVDQTSPAGRSKALSLIETTPGGTDGVINWADGRTGWDGEWKLSGLFYTESLNTSEQWQTQIVPMYITTDGISNKFDGPLSAVLGFSDGNTDAREFRITGGLIESEQQTYDPNWEQKTWYNYEIRHDGNGTYTGRFWRPNESRPVEPQAKSVGDPPGTEPRVAGILVNGSNGEPFEMRHDFIQWETSAENNSPPVADAGSDRTVTAGATVTLDASGSNDPDDDSLSYSWTQTAGPDVSLSDTGTATPEFTSPTVGTETEIVFEVTVDDGTATDTDTTTVTVRPEGAGPPPITGENPPQDIDGDGLYEDIDGSGEFDIFDIQALFNNMDNPAVQENAEYFNFDGDDQTEVNIFDVQALFNELN